MSHSRTQNTPNESGAFTDACAFAIAHHRGWFSSDKCISMEPFLFFFVTTEVVFEVWLFIFGNNNFAVCALVRVVVCASHLNRTGAALEKPLISGPFFFGFFYLQMIRGRARRISNSRQPEPSAAHSAYVLT